ncbi:MAG: UDP-3-O-(3-hydroxymyristoyl)glucosamine N-acyltransferase, partial [Bacteroidia bacterium]|nr:UDP-3-O-(3-hydroxymyristoyl)glucosamine N-acyltransferase [Bacteroidia bacterium]
ETKSTVVLVQNEFVPLQPLFCTLVRVDDPYRSIAKLLALVEKRPNRSGIEPMAFVHEDAILGQGVYIGAFSYVSKGARIGNNVKIFPHVYISEEVVIKDETWIFSGARIHNHSLIGSHCVIHSGVVIGGDGFGFAPVTGSDFTKVPQIGNVVIEDYVEIGTNTTIDRATIGSTIIRKGVKLDNLIQIGHNVEIGENTVIAAQTGISGSTKIGKNCMIGGQVGIIGHISIADGTKIAAQSGVGQSVKIPGTSIQGSPAFDLIPYQRSYVYFRKLPELVERIRQIEQSKNPNCKE